MAYLKATEIMTRARELVEDGVGSYRAIASSRFSGDLHSGVETTEAERLGILDTKPAEARITGIRAHPQRLSRIGNVNLKMFDLEVRVVRTVDVDAQVNDDTRDAIVALALEDADALDQAFGWPGNLAQTSASDATDWIGAEYVSSTARLEGSAGSAMRLDTIHRFECTAITRPATS